MSRIIVPLFIILIEWYFFTGVQAIIKDIPNPRKSTIQITYWVISLITFIGLFVSFNVPQSYLPNFYRGYMVSFFFIIVVAKLLGCIFLLLDDVFRLFRFGYQFVTTINHPEQREGISRLKFLTYTAGTIFSATVASMFYGVIRGAHKYRTHNVKLKFKNLPKEFDGLRIAQISDIHTGSFPNTSFLEYAFDKVLEQKPDVIFFTGDLVNDRVTETEGYLPVYQKLKAPMGVYSILGNHDYGDYSEWPSIESKKQNLEELKKVHEQAGWRLMINEHIPLEKDGAKIALLGIENWGGNLHFKRYGKMEEAYKGTDVYDFKILLSHDPSHWNLEVKQKYKDVDLTLSGHTHGFQFGIEIPGFRWSPVQYVYPQWAGLYEHQNQFLYVNRGLGCVGREKVSAFNGRVGIWPEITIIELNKA